MKRIKQLAIASMAALMLTFFPIFAIFAKLVESGSSMRGLFIILAYICLFGGAALILKLK